MEEKKIYIKNMVCRRCIMTVSDIFVNNGVTPVSVNLGTVVVSGALAEETKRKIRHELEEYGFEVIDLGKDVPPETVLEAVRHHQVRLVGLSALMTTTVGAMERTIALLHREAPGVLVMVGGAVLTQEYADSIHADFYGKHAMESVRYALRIFQTA